MRVSGEVIEGIVGDTGTAIMGDDYKVEVGISSDGPRTREMERRCDMESLRRIVGLYVSRFLARALWSVMVWTKGHGPD